MESAETIWTIGHSTRTLDEFLTTLASYGIELVADVRRFPESRRLPQFGAAELEAGLAKENVAYKWLPSLGGRRQSLPASPNTGWTHSAFRGYADHIATEEFAEGLEELLVLSGGMRTAIMCAEVLWWRCHRRIISDVLVTLGIDVVHIRDATHSEHHKLSAPAKLVDGKLSYLPDSAFQLGLGIG
jgi:uncharacterized protein (DUF488 family)